jgi:hypothetical protein
MTLKLAGWSALALAVVFGAGWMVGASGRAALEQARRDAEARAEFALARAHVLDGRVSLFQSNFGAASRAFEAARGVVTQAQARLRQLGDAARAGQLEVALVQLGEAQRLALALDGSAQGAAEQALRVIDAVSSGGQGR